MVSGGVATTLSMTRATIRTTPGPAAIKTEDGRLRLHVMFAAAGRDEGSDAGQIVPSLFRDVLFLSHPAGMTGDGQGQGAPGPVRRTGVIARMELK